MIEAARSEMFERVFLEHGAVTWPNGFDLSPWCGVGWKKPDSL
jgi:hypothetical protein